MNSAKKQKITPFIQKLDTILEDISCQPYIKWNDNNDGFIIINPQLFASYVLPLYFKHKNYGSFLRQLSFYNFNKIRISHQYQHMYQHPFFLRDNKQLLTKIKRQKIIPTSSQLQVEIKKQNIIEQNNENKQDIDIEISRLKKKQEELIQYCKQALCQNQETIDFSYIKEAEIKHQNYSQQFLHRINQFIQNRQDLAEHFSHLNTSIIYKFINFVENDLTEYFTNYTQHPHYRKLIGIIQNNQLSLVTSHITTAFGKIKNNKPYAIVHHDELQLLSNDI